MAEDTLKNILFAFIFMTVFGLLILTATTQVADDYGKDTTDVIGGSLSLTDFNNSITDINETVHGYYKTFTTGSIWDIGGVVVTGIFGVAKLFINLILLPFNLFSNILIDIFYIPVWLTTIIFAIIVLSIILGIWRLVKIGD